MGRLELTVALNDSDHVRDLASGRVRAEGIELRCLNFEVEEIFFRFTRQREWDVSELSLGKYAALRARGDESLAAIPVFPSRMFRHSAIYIRADGPRDDPAALRGGRIGIPEWTVTATVYGRALLQHEYGVGQTTVGWVQGGTNEPGRIETLPVELPPGVAVEPVHDRSLAQLLLAGEIDAILAPHPPAPATDGSGRMVRLFTDPQAVELDHFRRTGVFPIMHVIAIRAEVLERHPWVAANLYSAFDRAKQASLERMLDANAPRSPIPWAAATAAATAALFDDDPWPYGIESNRPTLEAFLGWAHEQGVCERRLDPGDLFAPGVREFYRV